MTMRIRKLELGDYYKGYIPLITQLSNTVGNISFEEFLRFVMNLGSKHMIYVVDYNGEMIASTTLLIEDKLIHNIGRVGHIEDVVVDKRYRSMGVGDFLIANVVHIAKKEGCYKVILDCKPELQKFYERNGFKSKQVEMSLYFKNNL